MWNWRATPMRADFVPFNLGADAPLTVAVVSKEHHPTGYCTRGRMPAEMDLALSTMREPRPRVPRIQMAAVAAAEAVSAAAAACSVDGLSVRPRNHGDVLQTEADTSGRINGDGTALRTRAFLCHTRPGAARPNGTQRGHERGSDGRLL